MVSFLRRFKTTVGVDIGSGFVKVVVIDSSGKEPAITHIAHSPLMADAIVEGEIMDPQVVVETIRSLVEALGVKSKSVVTSVGGRDVIVRRIQMDRMKEAQARDVIRWEAAQYVTFDMDDVQLDFQILDPTADGVRMNVLLVVAKRDVVEQRVALLRDAGMPPTVVDVDAFALYNAFEYNYPHALDGTVALVNVGHEVSTVHVVQDGAPMLARDIPFGSRRLRERLRRERGLTAEDAEAVIQNQAADPAAYQEALTEGSEELAIGIERAVAFLSREDPEVRSVNRVYLSGGGARIPGMQDAVAQRLKARVEIANPFERLRVSPEAATLFPMEELAPMLMLPVGLALRGGG